MACCGQKRKPVPATTNKSQNTGNKVCPKCGWVMNRIHRFDQNTKKVSKEWICANKMAVNKLPCNYREAI